ncbi:MAG: homoserine kinase [Oscillospiraceae bacterium]
MIDVKIPATSANLGAGFDSLGLCLNLYNYISLEQSDTIDITSEDDFLIPKDKTNLVYQSVKRLYDICGKTLYGLKLVQKSNIPLTRGLGSSSACIVGGLIGANEMLGNPFLVDDLVNIASSIEGHPDNTTPALIGGIVTSVLENDKVFWVKQKVENSLRFVAVIPDFQLKTEEMRECLPKRIDHTDARFNLSRAALFSASLLQGKYENLKIAVEDKLHQPYRLPLIKNADDVFNTAYQNGAYAVFLSGAGPTMISIINEYNTDFILKMRKKLNLIGLNAWQVVDLYIDNEGAKITKIS